ncbi:MAG: AAA family ATPase [Candidatus Parabeggiatoa sp.]|nr:AAA family ATPase [Candidatus Parabeggiatoa sp.]
MASNRLIQKLKLQNFLSYGNQGEEIELQPLNVFIGPNGSGKSNLIEAFSILKATPTDIMIPIRKGGGVSEFLWKGQKETPITRFEAILDYQDNFDSDSQSLLYRLSFTQANQKFLLIDELVKCPNDDHECYHYHDHQGAHIRATGEEKDHHFEPDYPNQSIFSQRKEPDKYPEILYLGKQFAAIELYRNWHIGRDLEPRHLQRTDLPESPLLEDGSNLGLFLNELQFQLGNQPVIEQFQKFYREASELSIKIMGGTVQIFIREQGLTQPIAATRLSDGTLHYLFLMALLLDPTPPPLLCIEEPEIGLHPDILPLIADMLIEASQRTQLIVTTHSDALISTLPPESVIICERDDEGSHLHRLEAEPLKDWLENYTIGDLWRMGHIGGKPW